MLYDVTIDGTNYRLDLKRADARWSCRLNGREFQIDPILVRPDLLSLRIGDAAYEIKLERLADELHVWVENRTFAAEVRDPRSLRGRGRASEGHGPRKITAPMSGKVVRILVSAGDEVEAGDGIAVVEAMKMQNEIKSPKKGRVQKILVTEGAASNAGDVLAIVE